LDDHSITHGIDWFEPITTTNSYYNLFTFLSIQSVPYNPLFYY